MTVTTASFRTLFTEFASAARYPDPTISAYLALAPKFVNVDRWAELADFGVSLWIAHMLVLSAPNQAAAARGKTPGQRVGVINSKSIDGASVSYDTTVATLKDAGHWNMSTYGLQFKQYSQMMGAGPLQIGAGGEPVGPGYFQGVNLPPG